MYFLNLLYNLHPNFQNSVYACMVHGQSNRCVHGDENTKKVLKSVYMYSNFIHGHNSKY